MQSQRVLRRRCAQLKMIGVYSTYPALGTGSASGGRYCYSGSKIKVHYVNVDHLQRIVVKALFRSIFIF